MRDEKKPRPESHFRCRFCYLLPAPSCWEEVVGGQDILRRNVSAEMYIWLCHRADGNCRRKWFDWKSLNKQFRRSEEMLPHKFSFPARRHWTPIGDNFLRKSARKRGNFPVIRKVLFIAHWKFPERCQLIQGISVIQYNLERRRYYQFGQGVFRIGIFLEKTLNNCGSKSCLQRARSWIVKVSRHEKRKRRRIRKMPLPRGIFPVFFIPILD